VSAGIPRPRRLGPWRYWSWCCIHIAGWRSEIFCGDPRHYLLLWRNQGRMYCCLRPPVIGGLTCTEHSEYPDAEQNNYPFYCRGPHKFFPGARRQPFPHTDDSGRIIGFFLLPLVDQPAGEVTLPAMPLSGQGSMHSMPDTPLKGYM